MGYNIQIEHDFEEDARAVLFSVGYDALQYCKSNCPVDTGYMRSTMDYEIEGTELAIFAETDYAPITDYRTGWLTGCTPEVERKVKQAWNSNLL